MQRFGDWGHRTFERWLRMLDRLSENTPNPIMTLLSPVIAILTILIWMFCIVLANAIDWAIVK